MLQAKSLLASILGLASGSALPMPKLPQGRKERNPNSAESQYLIGLAEEKRERRAKRGFGPLHMGVGPYNSSEYFALRAAVNNAVNNYNAEHNPAGTKPTRRNGKPVDPLLGEKEPKVKKNLKRKQRAAIRSLAVTAALPKPRNNPKGIGRKQRGWVPFAQR